jgi:hypothetical protein
MRFEFSRCYDIKYTGTENGAMSKSNADHQYFKLGWDTVGPTKMNQEAFTHSKFDVRIQCCLTAGGNHPSMLTRQLQSNELKVLVFAPEVFNAITDKKGAAKLADEVFDAVSFTVSVWQSAIAFYCFCFWRTRS